MKNPEYFDEPTVQRVNEILKVAEELVRKDTDIDGWKPTKKEWEKKLRQTYFPLAYYDEHHRAKFTRSYKRKHPTLKYLRKGHKEGRYPFGYLINYWDLVRAPRTGTVRMFLPSEEFERKGKMSLYYCIFLDEDVLSNIRMKQGNEVFEAYVLYVFSHELLHMIKFIHVDILKEKWQDEMRTHSRTCEVFEQCEFPENVKDRVLRSFRKD